jgi:hypothetical protein
VSSGRRYAGKKLNCTDSVISKHPSNLRHPWLKVSESSRWRGRHRQHASRVCSSDGSADLNSCSFVSIRG